MKQSLQLKFSQHLALTPQLQQSIRLLQLSTQELNQELETLLQENPLLERASKSEDSIDPDAENFVPNGNNNTTEVAAPDNNEEPPRQEEISDDYFEFSNTGRWEENSAGNDDDNDFSFQEAIKPTLREHLLSQIKLLPLSERDQTLSMLLVDTINDDGYLEQSLEDFAAGLPEELEIDLLELQTALKHIQHLDPPGIASRNLSECLTLQLEALPEDTPNLKIAIEVTKSHLPLLATRDYAKLRKLLQCDDEVLRAVQQLVIQLNPRPGSEFTSISSDHYIQHEIMVKKYKGVWIASLNDEVVPKLRINQLYAGILKRNRDSSSQYLMSQMQEAKWMIKNIQQRFSTILRVSQAIVDRQRKFFEHGEVAMRPLVLREIADELGLHESTVSRVTTRKYMLTPRGVYELKYFFGSHVATESGGACSATAIRALIKQMVGEENPKKPLSDNQITDILSKQGIMVARRTIAKYRESLQIPAANQRKSL
ncbi:RNA polymerase factor sigma-54 [Methylovorus sp. MM2]|uniref:RNA polymerase factor sigma-54 n=1 Tax=Methylovorus sp. MM2 TaxID=1848038 RepID=UPI0007E1B98B|nr:RNA polymerase factor sigma-54 [Methylovorus sp. MM2]OAM51785.1 RNA polymerase factor sigma-54 [Methylovorus sp. MM2]